MRLLSMMLVVLALALAGCGSSSNSSSSSTAGSSATATSAGASPTHLATAKFIAHAGLAFGAFHRYIYKPLLAGEFKGGLFKHKLVVLKATAAAVFVAHEVKLAAADAQASTVLHPLVAPLTTLATGFGAALAKLKAGKFNLAEIQSANLAIGSIEGSAKSAGLSITEQVPSLP